ncbi:hypothetical protein LCGC14_2433170 [marine sediment metagenome]|uniref:DUF4912 domain-containing protein n=1 Tax=marine sediment metagenome TaxID=412755 RepID=A0A0F9BLB2_9ZZZZ
MSDKTTKTGNAKTGEKKRDSGGRFKSSRATISQSGKNRLKQIREKLAAAKNLAHKAEKERQDTLTDRLVVMVRDPFWLHAYWELSRTSVQRAKAVMRQHWHAAKPVLRLYEVAKNGTTSTARRIVRDIVIHGGVTNWYVDVQDPPHHYQMDIGYLGDDGSFFSLAVSNVVTTPQPGLGDSFDQNWAAVAKDSDRIYAMSGGYSDSQPSSELKEVLERQLQRTMGDSSATRFGPGAASNGNSGFNFKVDTELIVHGEAEPGTHITLRGEPVCLREDGTFAVRFTLPDRRHVLPVVARSRDGSEQRTIVLAVDRNTKVMEPVMREPGG